MTEEKSEPKNDNDYNFHWHFFGYFVLIKFVCDVSECDNVSVLNNFSDLIPFLYVNIPGRY